MAAIHPGSWPAHHRRLREDQQWPVVAGDLMILRGRGWPTSESVCPTHAAGPPSGGVRENLQLRLNVRGAGAVYFD
jgi:hypothetical protein